jgi:AraC-like DNA-binding protein
MIEPASVMTAATGRPAAVDTPVFAMDSALLSNGQHFSTADYSVARNHIEKTTQGLFELSLRNAHEFKQYDVRSAQLGGTLFNLVKTDCGATYDIEMLDDPDLVLLQIVMRGSAQLQQGRSKVDAGAAQMVLLQGMARSYKRWYGPSEQLMVRLSRSRMERMVADETGIGLGDALDFGATQVVDLERVSTLWNYLVTICCDLDNRTSCFKGRLGRLAERTLSLLLVNALPNNYAWAFAAEPLSSAAPYYVRQIESYIRNHAQEQITIDDLAAVGRVSARSIYEGFKRFRSTTPMTYLKAVRLDLARDILVKGRRKRAVTVTQAATAAGYTDLSLFSRHYKARFREAPSETLADA